MSGNPPNHLATGKPADPGQFVLERRARLVGPLLPARAGHLVDFGCGNGAQTPARGDAFDLAHRVGAVAAGADDRGVSPPVDAVQGRVVGTVEEVLHQSGNGSQVLRRGKDVGISVDKVGRAGFGGAQQAYFHLRFTARTAHHCVGHLLG